MQSLLQLHFGTNGPRFFLSQKCCRSFKIRTYFMLKHPTQHLDSLYIISVRSLTMNRTLKSLCEKDCWFSPKTSLFEKHLKKNVFCMNLCSFSLYSVNFFILKYFFSWFEYWRKPLRMRKLVCRSKYDKITNTLLISIVS